MLTTAETNKRRRVIRHSRTRHGCGVSMCRTRVVSPILDVIHRDTFKYNATWWPVWGVFDWNLDFSWESKPQLLDGDSDLAIEPVL